MDTGPKQREGCRELLPDALDFPGILIRRSLASFTTSGATERMDPMLRRPFSMHRLTKENGILCVQILYRVIGKGTEWLSSRKAGETLDLIGPLGNGFLHRREPMWCWRQEGSGSLHSVPWRKLFGPWLLNRVFTSSWVPGSKTGSFTRKNLSALGAFTFTRTTGVWVFRGEHRNFFCIFLKQGKCLEPALSMRAVLLLCSWSCPRSRSVSVSRARLPLKPTWAAALEPAFPVRSLCVLLR